jgi:probable addiction module antidote protein
MPLETTPFDATVYIKTPERQAEYLLAALEDGDPSVIALVLGDIARARGASAFAKETGLSRETI